MKSNRFPIQITNPAQDSAAFPTKETSGHKTTATRNALTAGLMMVLLSGAGCAANHSFPRDAALDVPSLVSNLETRPKDAEALFDLTYWPLLHLDLQTFSKNDDTENYPKGHQFFSLRSWLPLFIFVDGETELFDVENAAYERNEFLALLWGLWARTELTVQTDHGERLERNTRFLWVFNWEDSVGYEKR